MYDFASRLKYLRTLNNLTQQKLASDISEIFNYPINKMSISFYENRKRYPDVELLIILSQYFDCSVDYLVGLSDEKSTLDKTELALKSELINSILKIINFSDINTLMELKKTIINFKQQYLE